MDEDSISQIRRLESRLRRRLHGDYVRATCVREKHSFRSMKQRFQSLSATFQTRSKKRSSIVGEEKEKEKKGRIVCQYIFQHRLCFVNSPEHDYLWMNNMSIRGDDIRVKNENRRPRRASSLLHASGIIDSPIECRQFCN